LPRIRVGSELIGLFYYAPADVSKPAHTVSSATMGWTEDDSRLYQELAAVAVPDREEQMAALLTLLPFGQQNEARLVELGCGEGRLSQAVLDAYPRVAVMALDGSSDMLSQAAERLRPFGSRAQVELFDLSSSDWWPHLEGADAVVSSLAVHHLDGPGKRLLFEATASRLTPRGALLLADLIEPLRPEARELFASAWDQVAESQATKPGGSQRALERFYQTRWNTYRYPDPVDMPSPLFEQLVWLREAGFAYSDCFWLRAGHAIYGGYKSSTGG
jgi:tRNA (cmo5U34)-methyltransferase